MSQRILLYCYVIIINLQLLPKSTLVRVIFTLLLFYNNTVLNLRDLAADIQGNGEFDFC